eukprot:319195-Amphidinium_carterae.1
MSFRFGYYVIADQFKFFVLMSGTLMSLPMKGKLPNCMSTQCRCCKPKLLLNIFLIKYARAH